MLLIFVTGLIVTVTRDHAETATYFMVLSAVPILVAIVGAELHCVTDRLVANGLGVRVALRWLFVRELPLLCVLTLGAIVACGTFEFAMSLGMLVVVNVIAGLLVQEFFRVLVATSRSLLANFVLALRNTVPFLVALPLWALGSFSVMSLLVLWSVGGATAVVVGATIVARDNVEVSDAVAQLPTASTAIGTVAVYFPISVIVRSLLSLDVVVVGAVVAGRVVGLYGNLNMILLAVFTLADVAIVQWRLGSFLSVQGSPQARSLLGRELIALACLGSVCTAVFGLGLLVAVDRSASGVVLVLSMACATGLAVLCQRDHLSLYARNRDGELRGAYLFSGAVYAAGLAVAIAADSALAVSLAKLLGWLALAVMLWRGLRRGERAEA